MKADKMSDEQTFKTWIGKIGNEQLFETWEMTETIENQYIPFVRGWLMDEIEKRFPEGFCKWLDNAAPEDSELKAYCLG